MRTGPTAIGLAVAVVGLTAFFVVRDLRASTKELKQESRAQNERLRDVLRAQGEALDAIRELRMELEAARRMAPATAEASEQRQAVAKEGPAAGANVAPPASPEALENAEKAGALIDAAVARGRWTEQDRNAFRVLKRNIPGEQGFELQRRLAAAMNAHQIDYLAPGPPF